METPENLYGKHRKQGKLQKTQNTSEENYGKPIMHLNKIWKTMENTETQKTPYRKYGSPCFLCFHVSCVFQVFCVFHVILVLQVYRIVFRVFRSEVGGLSKAEELVFGSTYYINQPP